MKLEKRVKQQLLSRGFTKEQLLNNRGLIGAVIDETALTVVKNLTIPVVVGRSEQLSCATCEYGKFTTHKVCTTCFARDKHVPAT